MEYFDRLVSRARTIETLEIFDIMEIVVRDMHRYKVPDSEINELLAKYVIPLKKESEQIKLKYAVKKS